MLEADFFFEVRLPYEREHNKATFTLPDNTQLVVFEKDCLFDSPPSLVYLRESVVVKAKIPVASTFPVLVGNP